MNSCWGEQKLGFGWGIRQSAELIGSSLVSASLKAEPEIEIEGPMIHWGFALQENL